MPDWIGNMNMQEYPLIVWNFIKQRREIEGRQDEDPTRSIVILTSLQPFQNNDRSGGKDDTKQALFKNGLYTKYMFML